MNKEEMEKAIKEALRDHGYSDDNNLFDGKDDFVDGWYACAKEFEKELRIAKADIMNLTEEIERLKS